MVEVELWSYRGDDPSAETVYEWLWTLRVDGRDFELRGALEHFDPQLKIINLRGRTNWLGQVKRSLSFVDDPEEWARSLVAAYRTPYLVPYTVHDDDPIVADPEVERAPLELSAPAEGRLQALYEAQDEAILDGS